MAKEKDMYTNLITKKVECSVANTITHELIDIGFNILDKVGLLVQRIEYDPSLSNIQDMDTDGDVLAAGLVRDNTVTNIDSNDWQTIDKYTYGRTDAGTAATANFHIFPHVHDFSTLKGGGLLIPPKPLYGSLVTSGFTIAATIVIRIYFVLKQLSSDEYIELVETRGGF